MTFMKSAWLRSFLIGLMFGSFGCTAEEPIRSYTVTTDQQPPSVVKPVEVKPVSTGSRTLGVIIPIDGNYSRFIKFRGSIEAVSAREAVFLAFVDSITDVGGETDLPKYTLPAGWKENPPRQFVAKSFNLGIAGVPDVTMSQPIGGSLLENVRRWQKEVGAPEATEADLMTAVREMTVGGKKVYFVDTRGPTPASTGGMRGPFQGGAK